MTTCSSSSQQGGALFLLVFLMAGLFTSVVAAIVVTANCQTSLHQHQNLNRSLADSLRTKALLSAVLTDRFETAFTPSTTTPLSARLRDEVASL